MPTPDMSDDKLDALFRRGTEAYPEEPPPLGAWARMDDKLQAAAVTGLVRRRVLRLFVLEVAIVLLALLGWQAYREFAPRPTQDSAAGISSATTTSAGAVSPPTTPKAAASEVSSRVSVIKAPGTRAAIKATMGKEAQELHNATTKVRSGSKPVAAWLPPEPRRSQNVPQPELGAVGLAGGHFAESATAIQGEKAPQSVPSPAQPMASVATPNDTTSQPAATAAASDTTQFAPTVAPADSVEKPNLRIGMPIYRWNLSVVGGPSLTGVRATQGARLGGEVGVTVDYRITPRLRVRSGLVRSVKRYAAQGSDYYPPYGYWQSSSPILALDANCRITEVPLDLRYDVLVRPTYSLFLNAGLTTLLMRNERYAYQYEKNGALTSATWSLARGSNHAFGMLNLSGGVERAVNERWSVQAEPFVKLPLGGVGFGQIKLRSAGVAFSVKYGLLGRISP